MGNLHFPYPAHIRMNHASDIINPNTFSTFLRLIPQARFFHAILMWHFFRNALHFVLFYVNFSIPDFRSAHTYIEKWKRPGKFFPSSNYQIGPSKSQILGTHDSEEDLLVGRGNLCLYLVVTSSAHNVSTHNRSMSRAHTTLSSEIEIELEQWFWGMNGMWKALVRNFFLP